MIDFEALITMKSVNKDWKSILETLKICRQDKINVMLHADNYEWLKSVLDRQKIDHYTLADLVMNEDMVRDIVFDNYHLDKIVISSVTVFKAMEAKFVNRFFHIEVSHLRKSP